MKAFRREEGEQLHKFVERCAKELDDGSEGEVRLTVAYEDWNELMQLAPVAPDEDVPVELAVFIGEKPFVIVPLLGQARDTLVQVRAGAD